ncbi:Ribonucleoside-diphosphate reductase 1 subunit alpha [Aquicella siphonis]|uniref:Vitamin B12-dependent ribonucleotide reductase n=1 Tax=Aquicella siphonis TaxID=254247 RepID=A0A5E4PHW9_9COXI|nr:ribonucleoside-diphosphate reductase subunit alpha [Aquicella siphonis]VVC75926.1 Ribonucleoside-diphosphate reductase 1 subunit alpha [Aquicella siphonis]
MDIQSASSHVAHAPHFDVVQTAPGQIKVIRRNGTVTPFDANKIAVAMTKAFLAVEGDTAAGSSRIHEKVSLLTKKIADTFDRRLQSGGTIHIEEIQDQVELELMRTGEYKVAKSYVLYREERRRAREQEQKEADNKKSAYILHVTLPDGTIQPLDMDALQKQVRNACVGLTDVSPDHIIEDAKRNLFDKVPAHEVSKALVMSARTLIEKEPNYTYVAARLLLVDLRSEALDFLKIQNNASAIEQQTFYPAYLEAYLDTGIKHELLSPKLKSFDLTQIGAAIRPERDLLFTYLGLQTLYDRYFIHWEGRRFELPQVFFMRVAMGLAMEEKEKEKRAIEFYNLLSTFDFMSSTPTLFNSGTLRPQLSSCYLTTVPDDLDGIYSAIKDNALLSKYAGGLGNDWTNVRAMGAHIKGTNGKSLGVVPFLNVANATAVAVNQGGKRKGAVCAYLETWHKDIEEFLELRKNTGDERRRTHDMNTANWIPDLFMQRVAENQDWTLFSPNDVPDLHDLYGKAFAEAYTAYEAKAARGEIKNIKKIPAVSLWRKMLTMLFETGHPWVTFKDVCNLRSPQQHTGVVHSSNLCTEITLNTSREEIAVCNLGSINLIAHMTDKGLDQAKLRRTVHTALRMLDNVIDINYYSVPQARNSNMKHRPVGMGLMGFQDALYKLRIPYASREAVEFADRSMEQISYYAIEASTYLAEERGKYSSYEGSLWSKGILPIDSLAILEQNRGAYLEIDKSQTLDWKTLRERVKAVGMRNSNVLAIAPTATISNICGVSQSIEPTYQNLFVKSNLSGEFTVINPYLVADLKQEGLWDEVMVNDLKYYNGSVAKINRIPEKLKQIYATAFEVDPMWLVEAGSRRQKWIDQAQSLNLYMAQPSGKKLDQLYRHAWTRGLKTTYYLRSMGATNTEKATIDDRALNAVQVDPVSAAPKACLITDPTCEACQ